MKVIGVSLLGLLLLFNCSMDKTSSTADPSYFPQFEWSIQLPADFEKVPAEEWDTNKKRGKEAVENTYNEPIPDYSKQLFVVRKGNFNVMEANYQSYDEEVDGYYPATVKAVNEVLYTTLKTQMPNAKIDSSTGVETIGELDFYAFYFSVDYASGQRLQTVLFSRLFGNQELGISLSFMDPEAGKSMHKALSTSRFGPSE